MSALARLLVILLLCLALPVNAGVLTRAVLEKQYPAPWKIGEKDDAIPVWPVHRQNGPVTELVGYLFESIDFVAVPGFAGVPVNLLIAIDASGNFLDVRVISHHEPVFLDGLGEGPLHKFVGQYQGLSLKQNVIIDAAGNKDGTSVHIDGVAKATASVRIITRPCSPLRSRSRARSSDFHRCRTRTASHGYGRTWSKRST